MNHQYDPFAAAEQNARRWLTAVAAELGTDDRQYAYRAARAWLHAVRDRLTVQSVAHLGAQLPELLRGNLFEGWVPSRTPENYDAVEFTERFADEAVLEQSEVPFVASSVTVALRSLFSAGQLDHVLAPLPREIRAILYPEGEASTGKDERLGRLEAAVDALTEAVRTLARGLEESPVDEPVTGRAARAATEAHRILLREGQPT